MNDIVLTVENLTVAYEHEQVWLPAVRDFSLQIAQGETCGLVGESGSGKTTVALAIMRYLGQGGHIQSGSISFEGVDMLALSESALRDLWGKEIALVPQDPQAALNPSIRVGEQIAEILRQHLGLGRRLAQDRAIELLEMVRVPDAPRVATSYPHQISGGMQQRVLIAMALSTEPQLLILDEPTTGLDVTTQSAILDLFRDLTRERRTATLYVTHNLGVVASFCDRVAVLYAGELVEDAPTRELFAQPLHPYTEGLIDSVPQVGQTKSQITLQAIPGQIPSLQERQAGCVFAPRCALAIEKCFSKRPDLDSVAGKRRARCHRWPEIAAREIALNPQDTALAVLDETVQEQEVLKVDDLRVYFEGNRSFSQYLRRQPKPIVRAVEGVDLVLKRAQTVGIVGESGSGKTSLARAIVGLYPRTAGDIILLQFPLAPDIDHRPDKTLQQLQYVFQNPDEALNPHMTVGQTLRRPFISLLGLPREEADSRAAALLEAVRLPATFLTRYPSQLSGGEKQRVAIARAFATAPDLLVADEPVSALDVSVQASILNLLRELQLEKENSLILISHDLAVVGYLADRVVVMYLGRVMESVGTARLFEAPMHPYTEALLAAIPTLEPDHLVDLATLEGDAPSQINVPDGCPFHPRCPRYLGDVCREELPPWRTNQDGDRIYCHIPLDELERLQQTDYSEHSEARAVPGSANTKK